MRKGKKMTTKINTSEHFLLAYFYVRRKAYHQTTAFFIPLL